MDKKKVLLIIRDGWGMYRPDKYNAVANAKTPNMKRYLKQYPNSVLEPAGEAVGLPKGYQGSSEVGHLNMGAGRIVIQELKRIMDMIEDGTFFALPALKAALDNAAAKGSALHLMGLVQDEGVHAHQDHLYAIMREAKKRGIKQVYIHFFADGRDTPPRSALSFIKMLDEVIKEVGNAAVGTIIGRYYAMDRGEKWALTDQTYNALTRAEGLKANSAEEAITADYASMKNPNGQPIVDEYIPPTIIGGYPGIKDGDSVIHINFRQDRAIQLTKAFVEDTYPGNRWKKFDIVYCGLTRYYDEFKFAALPPMDEGGGMNNLLGEVISAAGLKQLRLAETQKRLQAGDKGARQIFETIGRYLGYAVAHNGNFYALKRILILGRVTSGDAGNILIEEASRVLKADFPEIATRVILSVPSEKEKCHGQAMVAASLPEVG